MNSTVRPAALVLCLIATALGGCATYPGWLNTAGASREQVGAPDAPGTLAGIQLVTVDNALALRLAASRRKRLFSESFATAARTAYGVGPGDVIEVSVWEAPPATLFGGASGGPSGDSRSGPATTRVNTLPEQMVSSDGTITVPFIGQILVDGHDPQWMEEEIARRLQHKANQPQVMVRVVHNVTAMVTVVGEVAASGLVPLTARGERLLDALAKSGGVRQPVNKMTLQLTRGAVVQSLPLQAIIQDARQNIALQPGDVVTALYQPSSFTVLGATGRNEEISFETQGISLAQALARSGGLSDARADARGVYIFRFEDGGAEPGPAPVGVTTVGKIPVIYQIDLRERASFFIAQNFTVENGDVLYVTNAPAAELQKFLNIIISAIYPAAVAKIVSPNL